MAVLQVLRSVDNSTTPRFARNPFCCYELTMASEQDDKRTRSDTQFLRGRSRRASLIQSPKRLLTRLSPEILESAV